MSAAPPVAAASTPALDETTNPRLAEALRLARLGIPVHPVHGIVDGRCECELGAACPHPGKHPHLKRFEQRATTDPSRIKALWRRWPNANVGVPTAPSS